MGPALLVGGRQRHRGVRREDRTHRPVFGVEGGRVPGEQVEGAHRVRLDEQAECQHAGHAGLLRGAAGEVRPASLICEIVRLEDIVLSDDVEARPLAQLSMEEPRLVQPSRRPAKTTDFMRRVLAGPTSVGSFVISTWVPIPTRLSPEEDQVLFDDPNEPFERQATRHLSRALAAAQQASDEALSSDAGLDAFLAHEQDGLSANLCEALVALAGEQEVPLGITLAWALDRPMRNMPSEFSFPTESISVLREAARELRQRLPEEVVRARGNVVRLHRDAVSGAGDVTIAGIVSGDDLGKLRRISASLAEEDYEQAIEAHQQFSDVEIVGELYQRGTRTYLRDARGFAVHLAIADDPAT